MATLSELGKFIRKVRIDKEISLVTLADALEVTPAYMSGIETGRKTVNATILNKISDALQLKSAESDRLNVLALKQMTEVRIPSSSNNAEKLLAYARKLDSGIDFDIVELFAEKDKE